MNNKRSKRHEGRKAITLAVVGAISMMIGSLNAAVVNITTGSTTGYTMRDDNTYVVKNSVVFAGGMTVADNSTAVIYVPRGVTLTANGVDGFGTKGGGAGIRVPETSTLIITGEGTVSATGGNAGNATDGKNGKGGSVLLHTSSDPAVAPTASSTAGSGGGGGAGGGGAGAAIGGSGGKGGNATDSSWFYGYDGADGEAMGTVYVIGSITCICASGVKGKSGSSGTSGSFRLFVHDCGWIAAA